MADNFYSFVYDEKAKTVKAYTNLTDDDIKYLEAATRLDYDFCLSMLEHYFFLKMPNTKCKSKAWRRDKKMDIWVYQIHRKNKSDAGWLGEGIYFYGAEEEAWKAVGYGFWMQGFYLNIERPFIMDRDLHDAIVHANDRKVSERMSHVLKNNEMDGVFWAGDMREEWCVLDPKQIKRASITRDDQGRIIPISYRFDLNNPDNRF